MKRLLVSAPTVQNVQLGSRCSQHVGRSHTSDLSSSPAQPPTVCGFAGGADRCQGARSIARAARRGARPKFEDQTKPKPAVRCSNYPPTKSAQGWAGHRRQPEQRTRAGQRTRQPAPWHAPASPPADLTPTPPTFVVPSAPCPSVRVDSGQSLRRKVAVTSKSRLLALEMLSVALRLLPVD
eukprot:COSAG04_NODE_241_length_19022_cov_38.409819_4_plen_181_part_00